MKHLLLTIAVTTAFTLGLAQVTLAQTAEATSNSAALSASQSQSAAGSNATGGSVTFNTPSEQTVRNTGSTTARIENAPSLGGLALGGSHPCQWSPFTGQISIVGGGLGGGGGEIDSACMLLVASAASGDHKAYSAAMQMIAARDPAACKAMYQAGMLSDCVDKKGRSLVKPAPTVSSNSGATRPVARPVSLEVECRKVGNKTTPVVSKAVWDMYGREAVMNACR